MTEVYDPEETIKPEAFARLASCESHQSNPCPSLTPPLRSPCAVARICHQPYSIDALDIQHAIISDPADFVQQPVLQELHRPGG